MKRYTDYVVGFFLFVVMFGTLFIMGNATQLEIPPDVWVLEAFQTAILSTVFASWLD